MATITLYTREGPGAGLTSYDVYQVRGVGSPLRVVTEEWKRDVPLWTDTLLARTHERGTPTAGKADLFLPVAGRGKVNLARCEAGLAVVVQADDTTIFWLAGGRCEQIERSPSLGMAYSLVRARCKDCALPREVGD